MALVIHDIHSHKVSGLKNTKQRKAILSVLAQSGEPLTAEDIYIRLKVEHEDVSLSTVYRALAVYITPSGLKKSRPSVMLNRICRATQRDTMLRLIFKHTTTLGVRECTCRRYSFKRTIRRIETGDTSVRVKEVKGWGVSRAKLDYEDVTAYARANDLSLAEAAGALTNRMREE